MTDTKLPMWARKPVHKNKVVATTNGWIVESTGELLVRVRDLDKKLAEYLGVSSVTFDNTNKQIVLEDDIITTVDLPVSPVFDEGYVIPVVAVGEQVVPVAVETPLTGDEVVTVVETEVSNDVTVQEPAKEVVVVNADLAVVSEKENVVVSEPVAEVVEVPVKKKAGRPKKVITNE